jgi:hypothetical protein
MRYKRNTVKGISQGVGEGVSRLFAVWQKRRCQERKLTQDELAERANANEPHAEAEMGEWAPNPTLYYVVHSMYPFHGNGTRP